MKLILASFVFIPLLLTHNAFATDIPNLISGPLESVYCSEVDPFIGDQCIVYTTDKATGERYGLIFEDYIWMNMHISRNKSYSDYINEEFYVEFCDSLYSEHEVTEYKQIDSNYFYLTCNVDLFQWQESRYVQNIVLKNISANIESVWCGELNPHTDDICIIKAIDKKTNKKYSFLFEGFEWLNKYLKSDDELKTIAGQSFKISSCEKMNDKIVLSEFNKQDRENTFLCPINNFSWQ